MNIAFACPSYGPIDPKVVHAQRHAIMMAWANGSRSTGTSGSTGPVGHRRNRIAYSFLPVSTTWTGSSGATRTRYFSPDAIINLVSRGGRMHRDLLRSPPSLRAPRSHVYKRGLRGLEQDPEWPSDGSLFPVHGHGFGCVYTSRGRWS